MTPNEQQLEALLRAAAQRLGTTPEALKQAAQSGELGDRLPGADPQLQKALTDPEAARKLLSTPQAQQLLRLLGGGTPR